MVTRSVFSSSEPDDVQRVQQLRLQQDGEQNWCESHANKFRNQIQANIKQENFAEENTNPQPVYSLYAMLS